MPSARGGRARPLGLALLALVLGGGTGLAAVLVHRDPGLLALAAAATVAALAVLPSGVGVPAYALGWVAPLVAATVPARGGGFLVTLGDLSGLLLVLLGLGVVVTGAVRARPRVPEGLPGAGPRAS